MGKARPEIDRFNEQYIVVPDGCWIWTHYRNHLGYGYFNTTNSGCTQAYRFSYEYHVGPIPKGLVLDHLCKQPSCVNWRHLEAVTQGENARRGWADYWNNKRTATHCKNRHEFTPENTYIIPRHGFRACRACKTIRGRKYDQNYFHRTVNGRRVKIRKSDLRTGTAF
jgi:hypothetical protein